MFQCMIPKFRDRTATPCGRVLLDALDEGTAKASRYYRSAKSQKLVNSEQ
jgi:hypothetical protein